jgi:ATP synthase protein I
VSRTPQIPPEGTGERMSEEIGRKAERKLKARSQRDRGIWFGLGMFGLVGWAVAIPTLLGIGLGLWLDSRFPGRVSWTVTLLFVGVILGCLNAWYWVQRESRHDQ